MYARWSSFILREMIIGSHSEGGFWASGPVSAFGDEKNLFDGVWAAAVDSVFDKESLW
jgi:hypothetical protein